MNRDLDGVYFRIKRKGKYVNVCFSDLTAKEKDSVCAGRSVEWFKTLAYHLAEQLKEVGDTFDIVGRDEDET